MAFAVLGSAEVKLLVKEQLAELELVILQLEATDFGLLVDCFLSHTHCERSQSNTNLNVVFENQEGELRGARSCLIWKRVIHKAACKLLYSGKGKMVGGSTSLSGALEQVKTVDLITTNYAGTGSCTGPPCRNLANSEVSLLKFSICFLNFVPNSVPKDLLLR
jgi:hypothetical protein